MSMIVNTNVSSLTAQRSLAASSSMLDSAMERLSTGSKINSASDDAAGLAIANRLNAEINGIHQAVRNASDAQGMLAVAEGALEQVHALLLRMRELAVQSANETVSSADRNQLQTEVAQLESEIQRIVDDTTWAGITLLAGGFTTGATFQIGPRESDTIQISISAI